MSDRPRVLVLTPDFPPAQGGIQHLVHRMLQHAPGLDARVVTLNEPGAASADASCGLDVRRVGPTAGRHDVAVARLNAACLRHALGFRPDVVLCAHVVTSPAAATIRRAMHVPVVQYFYAKEIGTRPRLSAFAMLQADASVAISRHTRELLASLTPTPCPVHLITPGVDLPSGAGPGDRVDRPTVLTVARLESRYKGFDVMVRAMALVRARVPDAQWILIGDGPLRVQVERLAAACQLDGAVEFLGSAPDETRDAWLGRAHVFAMPSRVPPDGRGGEGFGIAYLEASAHGLPVVAGNVGGAMDAVVDEHTGLLVDPTDHVAVAEAIAGLLLDPARASALGRAGREHATAFAWPVVAEQLQELLLATAR